MEGRNFSASWCVLLSPISWQLVVRKRVFPILKRMLFDGIIGVSFYFFLVFLFSFQKQRNTLEYQRIERVSREKSSFAVEFVIEKLCDGRSWFPGWDRIANKTELTLALCPLSFVSPPNRFMCIYVYRCMCSFFEMDGSFGEKEEIKDEMKEKEIMCYVAVC